MEVTSPSPDQPGLEGVVGRVAGLLRHTGGALSAGDVATLRRMDPRKIDAPFFKLAALALEGQFATAPNGLEEQETRWAAIVVGLAHLAELHESYTPLGRALAAADLSEIRFTRLLQADADRLIDELPSLARFLSAKGIGSNWADAARLMLSCGRSDEEKTRRRLARDYYGALSRREG